MNQLAMAAIVVDFDLTITKEDSQTFDTRSVDELIHDHLILSKLIGEINQMSNIKFIVASFAYKPTITRYMVQISNLSWGNLEDLSRPGQNLAITTPRDYGYEDETTMTGDKNMHLAKICQILGLSKSNIYFFDNNATNIKNAVKDGYPNCFLVNPAEGFVKTLDKIKYIIYDNFIFLLVS